LSNNSFYQDDANAPFPPEGQQGKLILPGPQSGQRSAERKPYHYPPNQQTPNQYPPAQNQPIQNRNQNAYPQNQMPRGYNANAGPAPAVNPNVQQYPYQQPGQIGTPQTPTKQKRPRRRRGCLVGCLTVLLLFVILCVVMVPITQRVLAFGSAISTQAPLSTQTGYVSGSNRLNLLIMGYGGSGHDGAYLTDSMEVISIDPSNHHTTLISVPRDLWVQIPPNSGQYAKLNYAYVYGSNNGQNPVGGGTMAAQKISVITGLDVKYWATINFSGFRDFINAIGGVEVNVPDSFSSLYPANDNPSINASWITIHFNKGLQHMDGETAIEYARAREAINDPAEGTDFARSKRQQIIMQAALSRLKSPSAWPSLYGALDALQKTVYSNMSLADLGEFALHMDLSNAHHANISYNVLQNSVSSDGQDILLPINNNWQGIIDYVKQSLYN
jgi:LCP family protein required for cell wall assembly